MATNFSGPVKSNTAFWSNPVTLTDLPTASPANEGYIYYVSDALKPSESEGNGTGNLVFSNGSEWVTVSAGAGAVDPDFASVSMLLKTTSGGSITDVTNNFGTINLGTAVVNSNQTKFQTGSLELTSDVVTVPYGSNRSLLDFGAGDFTVEFWMYRTSAGTVGPGTSYDGVLGSNSGATNGWTVYVGNTDNKLYWYSPQNASINAGTATISFNAWTHIAIARSGSTLKTFIGGVEDLSMQNTTNQNTNGAYTDFYIGADVGANRRFIGYLEDIRITKGVARYTSTFTPPTEQFPSS